MGGACSRAARGAILGQSAAVTAQSSSPPPTELGPASTNVSWIARGISIDICEPPLDSLLHLSLQAIRTNPALFSSFEQLPQDLSQRVFDALVAEQSGFDKDSLKKFKGCYLRDINLGTCPGVDDTWVEDILAAGCGYIERLNLANSLISTSGLMAILGEEKNIRVLNLGRCKNLKTEAFKSVGGLAKLEDLVLEGNAQVTKSVLRSLSGLERLTKMDVSCSPNVTGGFQYLTGMTRLKRLRCGWCTTMSDADLACLEGLSNLEELQLTRTDITDAGLASLAGLSKLRYLDLGGCKVTNAGIAALSGLAALSELRVDNCPKVGDAALKALAGSRSLARLNLSYTSVTDTGLAALADLPALSAVSLDSCHVTDAGMAHVGRLRSLTELDLSDTAVGDEGMAHVRRLTALTSLNLSYSTVSDAGLRALRALPNMRVLNLDSRLVTDLGLANIGPMPTLEELDLFGAKISDAGAVVIAQQFRRLRVLEICGGGLTDRGVEQLAYIPTLKCLSIAQNRGVTDGCVPAIVRGMRKLSCLNVTHCRITNAGATQLVRLPELRSLTLYDCKVSKMAVETIQMQCPYAVILSNH